MILFCKEIQEVILKRLCNLSFAYCLKFQSGQYWSLHDWEQRNEKWQHDDYQNEPKKSDGDTTDWVPGESSGGFCRESSGLWVPGPKRPGAELGSYRWTRLLREEGLFSQLAGTVRKIKKTYTLLRESLYTKLILTTGKLNYATFGSTRPPGPACCPRRSIWWFMLKRKTQKMEPEVKQT